MIDLIFVTAKTQLEGILNDLLLAVGCLTALIFIPAGYLMIKRIFEVCTDLSAVHSAAKLNHNVGSNRSDYDLMDLTADSEFVRGRSFNSGSQDTKYSTETMGSVSIFRPKHDLLHDEDENKQLLG